MKPENVTCPICEGPMVSRANKASGQRFWGCKKYPECKGTRNTDGESKAERFSTVERTEDGGGRISCGSAPSERQRENDRERWRKWTS